MFLLFPSICWTKARNKFQILPYSCQLFVLFWANRNLLWNSCCSFIQRIINFSFWVQFNSLQLISNHKLKYEELVVRSLVYRVKDLFGINTIKFTWWIKTNLKNFDIITTTRIYVSFYHRFWFHTLYLIFKLLLIGLIFSAT